MRHLANAPYISQALSNAHAAPPTNAAEATTRWRQFKPHKKKMLNHLVTEQYQLCCYSELRADESDLGYHIEHVINKGMVPGRTFDYSNLAASAVHSEQISSVPKGQVFGGHSQGKIKPFDETMFISCHDPDCARFFAYLSDGRVVPREDLNEADQARAQYTIELLNLDSPFLRVLRRNWWDALDEDYTIYIGENLEVAPLVEQDLLPHNGKLKSFFTLTRHFYGQLAEDTLVREAPQLL